MNAVLELYKERLWPEVVQPVFDRVSDPIERIFGILEGYRRLLEGTDYLRGCPIGNLALELAGSHPAARQLIAENFTGWLEAVEAVPGRRLRPAARFGRPQAARPVRAHHDGRGGDAGADLSEHRPL